MKETTEARAVTIAAKIMTAVGLCIHDSITKCRRGYPNPETCDKCIREWLIAKARQELKNETEETA